MVTIERVASVSGLPAALHAASVAIGNFDGVHRGHRAVLDRALAEARARGVPAVVLTFEPHPRAYFAPQRPLFRVTPAPIRARLLGLLGFDAVVEQPFTADFAGLDAEAFVSRCLVGGLALGHVTTGVDFHFGKGRQGGPAFMIEAGARHGFGVALIDSYRDEGAEIVSSSRIRTLLAEGEVAEAAGLLGYRYTVEAPVVRGKQLGRTLGYPTANMELPADNALRHGVYAVRLRRADGTLHDGVASFGRRPTVDEAGAPLLETYVFDLDDRLYGETCSVSFFGFLRPELKFDGLEPLVTQMRRDEAEARALLSGVRPLSDLDLAMGF